MKKILVLFVTLLSVLQSNAQEPNDCVNAIIVCGNGVFESNASGIGTIQEVSGCSGFEHNSIWLKINIVQSGTLGFDLIPNDPSILVDYDFWVYGPNTSCGALGSPIRCCTTNPNLAGLATNHTGMYASSLQTQSGPGANGNGYVRWLNVLAGQSYYIAIDRPNGNGGFQLQWTGTATAGTGAFPSPPTANNIPDYPTCSSTPNIGIFDLDSVRSSINSNTTNNTISFFGSLANTIDNINALPNIISNSSNPQIIYVRVTNNITGCFTTSQFNLVVNPLPLAGMTVSNNTICEGQNVTVSFTGSPNATIEYTVNGGAIQNALLNNLGSFVLNESPLSTATYVLVKVKILDALGNVKCSNTINHSETVTIIPLPTASISGSSSICSGTNATILFNGTPNAMVTYFIDSGSNQTIPLDATGNAVIPTPILTTNSTYNLVSVATNGTPWCSQNQNGSALITVTPSQTVTISGDATICSGNDSVITFNGTPNSVVTYNIDSGVNQNSTLNNLGIATVTTPILYANSSYNLVGIGSSGTPNCYQLQSGSALVSVIPLPTVTISGTNSICSGNSSIISFNGTPNAIVTYTINSGLNQTITLDATGNASFTTTILNSTTTYNLVSIATTGTPSCMQLQNGSAIVTVISTPTVTISGSATICTGNTTLISFSGTPGAIVTYTINSSSNQSITLDGSGNASFVTPPLTTTTTYDLVNIETFGTPTCGQTINGSALISIINLPTAAISGTTTICSGTLATINFSGTPNSVVTFNSNGGANTTIQLDATGNAILSTTLTATTSFNLVSVSFGCTNIVLGTVLITVIDLPTATISGTTTICNTASAVVSFSGTPNAIISYSINSGVNQTINLDAFGNASLTTPNLITNSIYTLVSITSNGTLTCSSLLNQSVTITVTPIPTINATPSTQEICSGETTGITLTSNILNTIYNWSVIQNSVLGAANGAGTTISQILNSTGSISGTATYTITPTSNSCVGTPLVLTVTVKPKPIASITTTATSICSGTNTNISISSAISISTFSWAAIATNVTGASNGMGNLISQNLNTVGNASGFVNYSITPIANGCYGSPTVITINVSPQPIATATLVPNTICSGATSNIVLTSNETGTTFSWTANQTGIIGATSDSGNTINQILTTTGNITGTATYTVTPNNNGCIGLPITTTINVNPKPNVAVISINSICDGGTTAINLSSIIPGTTFVWTVTTSGVSGATNGSGNVINQVLSTTGTNIGTAIYSVLPSSNGCEGPITSVTIKVNPLPKTNLQDGIICLNPITGLPIQNYIFGTNLSNSTFDFEWFINGNTIPGETNNSYSAFQGGNYGVIITNTLTGCVSNLETALVSESISGESISLTQSNMFGDNQTIVVTISGGNGTYLYQLDNGPFQLTNTFINTAPGLHSINVTDTNGCTNLTDTIWVVGFPKYFTPNGDGYNDTWNIIGAYDVTISQIMIFDRFGKLIKQIYSDKAGWNGTYNGKDLIADDYWFVVNYFENGVDKSFRSHFALKR